MVISSLPVARAPVEPVGFVENDGQRGRVVGEAAEEQSVHGVGEPGEQTGPGAAAVDDRLSGCAVESCRPGSAAPCIPR